MRGNKLKGAMAEKGISQADIAKILGLSTNSVSAKINGKVDFKVGEMQKICDFLQVDPHIFFTSNVPKIEQKNKIKILY